MFTGLIEEIGALEAVRLSKVKRCCLRSEPIQRFEDVAIGDSISVNGVCLDRDRTEPFAFTVDVMPADVPPFQPERYSCWRTAQSGAGDESRRRFGGHIVQGHVDGTATIISRRTDANAVVFTIRPE